MWSPTHVQVLVKRARGLNVKGKNGTNDAFVTIGLGKEKFQTSVKERTEDPEWSEQCELSIPDQGNRSEVVLKVLHRNFMGGDEFLGQISLPLQDFDVYEKPKASWYPLLCKPGQNKTGYRGELEVKLGFTVRASQGGGSSGNRGSISSINKVAGNIGGSLLSLGGKEKKNLKKIAEKVSNKVEKVGNKAKKSVSTLKLNKDKTALTSLPENSNWSDNFFDKPRNNQPNEDPGVNSDDEDDMFQFEPLSHRSSQSSLATGRLGIVSAVATPCQGSIESLNIQPGKPVETDGELFGVRNAKLLGNKTKSHSNDTTHLNNDGQNIETSGHDETLSSSSFQPRASTQLSKVESQVTALDTWTANAEDEQDLTGSMSSLPSYNEAMKRDVSYPESKDNAKLFTKKKIIPVVSDSSESSPSPEEPSTPIDSPQPSSISSRFRMSQRSVLSTQGEDSMMSLGQKLRNSYSFRDKPEKNHNRRSSMESIGSQGPPYGTRIVLGRETSPVPKCRLPQEILERFAGQSREDLIEMVISLQASVEEQGKRAADLEDYVDSLLVKVMESSPVLLEKNVITNKSIK